MAHASITNFIEGYKTLHITYQPNHSIIINTSKIRVDHVNNTIICNDTAGIFSIIIQDHETYQAVIKALKEVE